MFYSIFGRLWVEFQPLDAMTWALDAHIFARLRAS